MIIKIRIGGDIKGLTLFAMHNPGWMFVVGYAVLGYSSEDSSCVWRPSPKLVLAFFSNPTLIRMILAEMRLTSVAFLWSTYELDCGAGS